MNLPFVIGLTSWFVAMWCGLYWLEKRRQPQPDPRIQELLEHEQAAHDAFQRTVRRVGRLPE